MCPTACLIFMSIPAMWMFFVLSHTQVPIFFWTAEPAAHFIDYNRTRSRNINVLRLNFKSITREILLEKQHACFPMIITLVNTSCSKLLRMKHHLNNILTELFRDLQHNYQDVCLQFIFLDVHMQSHHFYLYVFILLCCAHFSSFYFAWTQWDFSICIRFLFCGIVLGYVDVLLPFFAFSILWYQMDQILWQK